MAMRPHLHKSVRALPLRRREHAISRNHHPVLLSHIISHPPLGCSLTAGDGPPESILSTLRGLPRRPSSSPLEVVGLHLHVWSSLCSRPPRSRSHRSRPDAPPRRLIPSGNLEARLRPRRRARRLDVRRTARRSTLRWWWSPEAAVKPPPDPPRRLPRLALAPRRIIRRVPTFRVHGRHFFAS